MSVEVSGKQLKEAMVAAGIDRAEHHACGGCGYMTAYVRRGDELFFDAGCDCTRGPIELEPRDWTEAARWVNMQVEDERRAGVAKKFGLELAAG
jgi:hypothetical protein